MQGAGKTTTINILSGMYAPTSGDALVNGMSILGQMKEVRKSLGFCPQHNILYDILTVKEHLVLFARLKVLGFIRVGGLMGYLRLEGFLCQGVPGHRLEEEVKQIIEQVGLTEKVHAFASTLSGGMQRKLSVAIALIGGSKVVFLVSFLTE